MAKLNIRVFDPGHRLFTGKHFNDLLDAINNVIGGGCVIANSSVFLQQSVASGLTAVGTNQATSLALTKGINVISTAAASTGVSLPPAATVGIGGEVTIYNDGASAIKVYAGVGTTDTIDGTAGATGVTLTNATRCRYVVTAAGVWKSDKLGAVSS